MAEESNGPKIGSKIFDDDAVEIVWTRDRGKRISCHKQRGWHTCGMLTALNAAI